jgi:hypothetical protein
MRALAFSMMAVCMAAAGWAAEWKDLFDGRTLKGWRVAAKPADKDKGFWSVKDGAIFCDSLGRPQHDYVWLMTEEEFGDFELNLEVKGFAESPGNTGVQVRSRYDETAGWLDGPQVDVHPPGPWRTGLIYDETRGTRRWVYPSLPDSRIEPAQGPKEWKWNAEGWNRIEIVCRGTRITTRVNGYPIADFEGRGILDDDAHRQRNVGLKGHIALQLHTKDELRAAYRNLRVRTLD